MPKNKKTLSFEERLLFVTRNFVEYGNYGKNETKAVRVIRKYFPAYSEEKIRKSFVMYVRAYRNSIEFVERYKDYYIQRYPSRHQIPFFADTTEETNFYNQNSSVPADKIRAMIYWIFDWHQLR